MQKGLSPHVKYDSYWGHVNHYGLRVAKPFTYLFVCWLGNETFSSDYDHQL